MSKVQSALLSDAQGTGRDKGLSIYFRECGVPCRWINQQLAIQREHCNRRQGYNINIHGKYSDSVPMVLSLVSRNTPTMSPTAHFLP